MLNKGCAMFEGSREGVEPRLRGGYESSRGGLSGGSMVYFVRGEDS